MKKILLTVLLTLFAWSAQADSVAVDDMQLANEYKSAVKSAKSERRKAKKAGFEWRDIGKFLKSADKKYKEGDIEGAMKLVARAKTQALLGQQQAKDQANAGPNF